MFNFEQLRGKTVTLVYKLYKCLPFKSRFPIVYAETIENNTETFVSRIPL